MYESSTMQADAVKQAFPNAAKAGHSTGQTPQPNHSLQDGLHRLSNLVDFARDLTGRARDLADNLGGPIPIADGKGQVSDQGNGQVGSLYGLADQFEATLVRLQGELDRIRAMQG